MGFRLLGTAGTAAYLNNRGLQVQAVPKVSEVQHLPPDQRPRFFVDIGKADGAVAPVLEVVNELTRLRISHEWHLWEGAHNRAYWGAHVEDYLRWYAKDWIQDQG